MNKKHISLLLAMLMCFSSVIPSFAYDLDASENSVEEIIYQNTEDEDYTNETNIFAEIGSEYKVTIPKTIVLSGTTKSADYYVKVEGDIAAYESIYVIPDDNCNLYSINKDVVLASIVQDKTTWTYSTLGESANGQITADKITAGKWSGVFNFYIDMNKVLGDVIEPNHDHTFKVVSKIDATCTSPSTEFYRCACGETKTEHAVDIIEHPLSEENKENIVESTCLDSGSYDSVFYCTMCGTKISRQNVITEPLGHEFVDGYCVRCNKPEHTHVPGEAVTENIIFTVENVAGSYESVVYCTDCGEELSRETKEFTNATVNYTYTGKTQIFEAPIDGDYKLEVWGAQGGSSSGGRGAYVTGVVNLKKGEILYVNVGAQPSGGGGGWNGGGTNRSNNYGGGGATDIALYGTKDTTSWNTSDHLYSRIIVAGAGGGYNGEGGNGGGYGGFTSGGNGSGNEPGYGASISGGGSTNKSSNCVESPTNGSFGIGGTNAWCNERLGAGGSGWYGGGAGGGGGDNGSGGGGSSYAWCASYASYMPDSSYKPSTNYYLSSVSGSSNTNTGHGKAKITLISK